MTVSGILDALARSFKLEFTGCSENALTCTVQLYQICGKLLAFSNLLCLFECNKNGLLPNVYR